MYKTLFTNDTGFAALDGHCQTNVTAFCDSLQHAALQPEIKQNTAQGWFSASRCCLGSEADKWGWKTNKGQAAHYCQPPPSSVVPEYILEGVLGGGAALVFLMQTARKCRNIGKKANTESLLDPDGVVWNTPSRSALSNTEEQIKVDAIARAWSHVNVTVRTKRIHILGQSKRWGSVLPAELQDFREYVNECCPDISHEGLLMALQENPGDERRSEALVDVIDNIAESPRQWFGNGDDHRLQVNAGLFADINQNFQTMHSLGPKSLSSRSAIEGYLNMGFLDPSIAEFTRRRLVATSDLGNTKNIYTITEEGEDRGSGRGFWDAINADPVTFNQRTAENRRGVRTVAPPAE
jgi:hypothetical protein